MPTVLITGANRGIGLAFARSFIADGWRVHACCRHPDKARDLRKAAEASGAATGLHRLDVTDGLKVASLARELIDEPIDVLINNAGVMAIPYRRTVDGFEMQFGTNHLGHFALTGLLLERLLATPGARVVTVSSNAHKFGAMRWDDLQWERGYRKWFAYSQSKLANLLFANELQRRLAAAKAGPISVACHPGYAATNLQGAGPRMQGSSIAGTVMELANRLFAQNAAMGALPTLYAATAPDVRGGDYIGPDGLGEQWGHPKKVRSIARANDAEAQRRLWETSERLTGVRYEALH